MFYKLLMIFYFQHLLQNENDIPDLGILELELTRVHMCSSHAACHEGVLALFLMNQLIN